MNDFSSIDICAMMSHIIEFHRAMSTYQKSCTHYAKIDFMYATGIRESGNTHLYESHVGNSLRYCIFSLILIVAKLFDI